MTLLSKGTIGAVYHLDLSGHLIAVKIAHNEQEAEADHLLEQSRFSDLAIRPPIPYLVRCLHQVPKFTFLEYMPNGSLAMLLNSKQQRELAVSHSQQVPEVSSFPTAEQRHRWMWQLCCAAAGLADAGLAHGDIRPGNILLDSEWNAYLCDLDRCVKVGDDLYVASEPFGRLLDVADGAEAGTFGKAGARTETFAIGSVLYSLLNGHEPYETEYWGSDHGVIMSEHLQRKGFPLLGDSTEESIIRRCWHGGYESVHDLWTEFTQPVGTEWVPSRNQQLGQYRELCETVVQNGDLGRLR